MNALAWVGAVCLAALCYVLLGMLAVAIGFAEYRGGVATNLNDPLIRFYCLAAYLAYAVWGAGFFGCLWMSIRSAPTNRAPHFVTLLPLLAAVCAFGLAIYLKAWETIDWRMKPGLAPAKTSLVLFMWPLSAVALALATSCVMLFRRR